MQHAQGLRNGFTQIAPVADHVYRALFKQELCPLETRRQLDAHGVFNHARTGKADQRLGFCNDDIAHESKTGAHAAHGRIRQHADVGQALFGQPRQRRIGFGHLHERQQPFLHARAARGSEAHKRHFLGNGMLHASHKALAHHAAHAAAHEVELEAGSHQLDAAYAAAHHDQRIGFARAVQRIFQALGVFAAVLELQGINRQYLLPQFVAAFGVQKSIQPRTCANAMVMAALRAYVLVLLQIAAVKNRFAAGALDPQAFGHSRTALGFRRGFGRFGRKQFFKPTHQKTPITTLWPTLLAQGKAFSSLRLARLYSLPLAWSTHRQHARQTFSHEA